MMHRIEKIVAPQADVIFFSILEYKRVKDFGGCRTVICAAGY
jgi:hypothetical protein